jgi:hypothetical protein
MKKMKTDFTYKQINGNYFLSDGICASKQNKKKIFIAFTANLLEHSIYKRSGIKCGWKFHLAIDSKDVGRSWDIIKDILIDNKIVSSKVVKENEISGLVNHPTQCGKQITIYCRTKSELSKDWQGIITKITQSLINVKIQPASFSPGDQPVYGSPYVSYRYDGDENGNYVSAKIQKTYKPSGIVDVFSNIKININNYNNIQNPGLIQQQNINNALLPNM